MKSNKKEVIYLNLRQKAKHFKRLYEKNLPQKENINVCEEREIMRLGVSKILNSKSEDEIEFFKNRMYEELMQGIIHSGAIKESFIESPIGKIHRMDIYILKKGRC